jgi:argininosuccinate lyase
LEDPGVKNSKENILHKGRLGSFSEDASKYTSSIDIDGRLLPSVIKINSAHVVMLAEQGVLDRKVAAEIVTALAQVPKNLEMKDDLEDVHMNVENFVISRIGAEAGGMMNLAKSRNDQVATALRMALREQLITLGKVMVTLEKALLDQAVKHYNDAFPGYTHMQRGQPVTLGHHLLAHFSSLDRDFARLVDCYLRTDLSPMGAGALASTGININRERTAQLLGFLSVLENSLDAISSRDFATEAIYVCAQTMTDLGRFAEELILWTTQEFSFAEISNEFSSTSSMMPQKKNAIVPEIFRARTSQVLGDIVGAMGIVKALPLSYNLDLQELTRNLWSATDKTSSSISILAEVVHDLQFDAKAIGESVTSDEFLFATELADYLVQKFGVSFREAHSRVGKLVKHAVEHGKTRSQFTGLDFGKVKEILGVSLTSAELASIVDPALVLSKRKASGSPNPAMVLKACKAGAKLISKHEATLEAFEQEIAESERLLDSALQKIRKNRDESSNLSKIAEVKG